MHILVMNIPRPHYFGILLIFRFWNLIIVDWHVWLVLPPCKKNEESTRPWHLSQPDRKILWNEGKTRPPKFATNIMRLPIVPLHLDCNHTKKPNLLPIPNGILTGNYPSPTTGYHVILLNGRHTKGRRPYNMYQNTESNYGRSCFYEKEQANYETNYDHERSHRNHKYTPT